MTQGLRGFPCIVIEGNYILRGGYARRETKIDDDRYAGLSSAAS